MQYADSQKNNASQPPSANYIVDDLFPDNYYNIDLAAKFNGTESTTQWKLF